MAALPVEVLYGLYLGVLIGVVPVLVAWTLGFVFKYVTGVTIPGLGVVVLSVAIAGANGGLLALNDPTLIGSGNQIRLTVALVVVLMASLYAHAVGDRLGAQLPRRITLRRLTERTLSADVVDAVGGRGRVRVTVAGEVGDIEGYPPLPADLRAAIRETTYAFPADIPLVELESRVADRLRADHDLDEVSVRLDERAQATVAAAPPVGGLSKRVPAGERAVTVRAPIPAGLASGDEVAVTADGTTREASVLGVAATSAPDDGTAREDGESAGGVGTEGTGTPAVGPGEARVTLGVPREGAAALVGVTVDRLVALSRGTHREFELVSLLRRGGKGFRRTTLRAGGALDGSTLGAASVRDTYGVAVLAVRGRDDDGWTLVPRGDHRLAAGDALLVVGGRDALDRFAGAVA
ncbi:MAG: potassium channel family protein [Haloferacaceae archaeon]